MSRRRFPIDPLSLAGGAGALLFSVMLFQGLRMNKTTPRFRPPDGPQEGQAGEGDAPLRLLLLGESTIAGVGVKSHDEALCGSAAAMIAEESGRPVRWRAVGKTGITARGCVEQLVPRIDGERPDLMIIALGVNDVILLTGARRWAADVRRLLAEVRRRIGPHVPIVWCGVPPMSSFPSFPQPLRGLAHLRSRLLDRALQTVLRDADHVIHVPLRFQGGPEYFCDDGYHPSSLGYATWAEGLRPAVRRVLSACAPESAHE